MNQLADDHFARLDLHLIAVADDGRLRGLERGERSEGIVGVVLCHRRDGGIDEHDDCDGDGVDIQDELVPVVAGGPGREGVHALVEEGVHALGGREIEGVQIKKIPDHGGRNDRGHEQVHDNRVELNNEEHQQGDAWRLLELIGAIFHEASLCLLRRQARCEIRLQLFANHFNGLFVDLEACRRHTAVLLFAVRHRGFLLTCPARIWTLSQ